MSVEARPESKDIAIIGFSCRFPEASGSEVFLENLKNGKDSVRPISRERKVATGLSSEIEYNDLGYIEDIDLFDHDFFDIPFAEAEKTDPRLRLLLEVVHETLENSGYGPDFFGNSDTSVYVGDTHLDYHELSNELDATLISNSINSSLAGRVARSFNLRGSAEMIDTSCSSSLAALRHGCNDLILGESGHSLVCASKLSLLPDLKENNALLGIVSPDGKAKSFSDEANGTAWGEAVVCLLLKPLTSALADHDIIHAVIKSVAMNQDAALSASIAAPDSQAQSEVIEKAWVKAGVEPESIAYIEAHGTGTKLGDPIEIAGLDMAFGRHTSKRGFCAISSLKTNVGHTDCAAGLAGVFKAVLSLKHQLLFPSLHFQRPNSFIDFENSAVYVNTSLKEWTVPPGKVRRAGVSSFGLSGTNGHVILEEAPDMVTEGKAVPTQSSVHHLMTVSAKSLTSFRENLKALRQYLYDYPNVPLKDISYTLNTGRGHYPLRFAVLTNNRANLEKSLQDAWLQEEIMEEVLPSEAPIFIFSHAPKVTLSLLEEFSKYEAFKSSYHECLRCLGDGKTTDVFRAFAFQYAFYALLRALKVPVRAFMGDGSGQVVIDVLKEKTSLQEGIDRLDSHCEASNDITMRVRRFVEKSPKGTRMLFCEMGPEGNISQALSLCNDGDVLRLIFGQGSEESMLLAYLRDLYLSHVPLEMRLWYKLIGGRVVELPTYRFSRKRCWLPEANSGDDLYSMSWQQDSPSKSEPLEGCLFLIFEDETDSPSSLNEYLTHKHHRCISVKAGRTYRKASSFLYFIRSENEDDYVQLRESVLQDFSNIDGVFLYSRPGLNLAATESARILSSVVRSVHFLVKTFLAELQQRDFRLTLITFGAHQVNERDKHVSPLARLVDGLMRGVFSDFPSQKIKCIDFAADSIAEAEDIYREITAEDHLHFTAYRRHQRYVPVIKKSAIFDEETPHEAWSSLKEGGVYIISGGLGGIGKEIIRAMAEKAKSHFIILGRNGSTYGPEKSIIKELGSSSTFYKVNVGDYQSMHQVFDQIKSDFSSIEGVIHAAGIAGSRKAINQKGFADVVDTLWPKVVGTLVLDELARPLCPSFFVMFSSLNAIVPQKGSMDYAAANAFQDAYPTYKGVGNCTYMSISWPVWKGLGMGYHSTDGRQGPLKPIAKDEGIEIFLKLLQHRPSYTCIAPIDLGKFQSNGFFLTPKEILSTNQEDVLSERKCKDEPVAVIISIWEKILKIDGIKASDDFFDLGGHSLNGGQVVSELSRHFVVDMDFEHIYDYPTPAELAAYIGRATSIEEESKTIKIVPLPNQEHYDMSPAQKRLWLIHQLEKDMVAYNIPCSFTLGADLDINALSMAYEGLVERHESFRTTFESVGGKPYQRIKPFLIGENKIEITDLLSHEEPRKKCEEKLYAEIGKSFDLEKDPLIKAFLIKVDPTEYVFLIVMHHLVTDGWSLRVITEDLLTMYDAFIQGEENPLPPLGFQYKDYAAWLNSALTSTEMEKHKNYWMSKLRGPLTFTEFPLDFRRGEVKTYHGGQVIFGLDRSSTQKLRKFCLQQEVTLFVALTTVLKVLLHKYSGNDDIIIGVPVAGRDFDELKDQIGYYLNTIVLRSEFHSETTFKSLLEQIKSDMLGGMEHQVYPIDHLIASLGLKREGNRSPLFEIGFTWFPKFPNTEIADSPMLKASETRSLSGGLKNSQHDLWLYGTEYEDDIILTFEYNSTILKLESIELLSREFISGIDSLLENPSLKVSELNIELTEGSSDNELEEFDFKF